MLVHHFKFLLWRDRTEEITHSSDRKIFRLSQEAEIMLVYKGMFVSATMQITSIKTPGSSLKKTWWTLRSFFITLAGLLTSAPLFLSHPDLWNTLMYCLTKQGCCFFRLKGTRKNISCGVELWFGATQDAVRFQAQIFQRLEFIVY